MTTSGIFRLLLSGTVKIMNKRSNGMMSRRILTSQCLKIQLRSWKSQNSYTEIVKKKRGLEKRRFQKKREN
jgi:hypothetical protein